MGLFDNSDAAVFGILGNIISNFGSGGQDEEEEDNSISPLLMAGLLGDPASGTPISLNNPLMPMSEETPSYPNLYVPHPDQTVPRLAYAVGQLESGGKYDTLGPMTKGDRAYGKYQVMGNNVPSWSQEILGQRLTPQEFLANPQYQDQIAQAKLGQYYDKYGNINDAASMWFSGRPASGNSGRDVLGTSVPQYIRTINRHFYGF